MRTVFTVTIIESERGWGQRIDEIKTFDDADTAWDFVAKYNANNNESQTPDWYMMAMNPVMERIP